MNDETFLSYVELHSESERALFSREDANRLLVMAGRPAQSFLPSFVSITSDVAKPLVATARAFGKGDPPPIKTIDEITKAHVLDTLKKIPNRTEAAKVLGIDRHTLYAWLRKWGKNKRHAKEFVR